MDATKPRSRATGQGNMRRRHSSSILQHGLLSILLVLLVIIIPTGDGQNTTATPTPTPATGNGTAPTPTPTPSTSTGNGTGGSTPVATATPVSTTQPCSIGATMCAGTGCRGNVSYCGQNYCCCGAGTSVPNSSGWPATCPATPVTCLCPAASGGSRPTAAPTPPPTPRPTPRPACVVGGPQCMGIKSQGCLPWVQGTWTKISSSPPQCSFFADQYTATQDGGAVRFLGTDKFGFGRSGKTIGKVTILGDVSLCNYDDNFECTGIRDDATKRLSITCSTRRFLEDTVIRNSTIPRDCVNLASATFECVLGECLQCHECSSSAVGGGSGTGTGEDEQSGGSDGSTLFIVLGVIFMACVAGGCGFFFWRKNRQWGDEEDEVHQGHTELTKNEGLGMAPPPTLKKLPAIRADEVSTPVQFEPHQATRVKFSDGTERKDGANERSRRESVFGSAVSGAVSAAGAFMSSIGDAIGGGEDDDWSDDEFERRRAAARSASYGSRHNNRV